MLFLESGQSIYVIMKNLCKKYSGQEAVIILGGPSIVENKYDLSSVGKQGRVVFLDAKSLTPGFLNYGIEPDYFLMYYPDKGRTNTLQLRFLQAVSCEFNMAGCVKKEFLDEWIDFRKNFSSYAEIWDIMSPHKKFRIKKDIALKNSPFDLLHHYKNMSLIALDWAYDRDNTAALSLPNKVYKYTHNTGASGDLKKYYNPEIVNGTLSIAQISSYNSSAIALYPMLNYMGFKKVYFIGMDMSLLGHLEYAANYTFKSMNHYAKYFNAVRPTFSLDFPRGVKNGLKYFGSSTIGNIKNKKYSSEVFKNLFWDIWGLKGKFIRDRKQFVNCRDLFSYDKIEFVNIYEPFKYARPVPGVRNISYKQFLNE